MEVLPSRRAAVVFRCKAAALQLRRAAQDVRGGIRRWPNSNDDSWPHLVAQSRTPLWRETSPAELRLQCGKVQNLRVAAQCLNGIEIPAGQTFSFWKQVGRATQKRGFAKGRLLREGCLVPAVGGGLCQLSNALYDAALKAGLEIVERWAHSQTIPGSAAEAGRDATVAWNYIDLRFRAPCDHRISVQLTAEELLVSFHARESQMPRPLISLQSLLVTAPSIDARAHSCVSCGEETCFRHAAAARSTVDFDRTPLWLMDEAWPEFLDLLHAQNGAPLWPRTDARRVALQRSLKMRAARNGAAKRAAHLRGSARVAAQLSRGVAAEVRHLVVAQSLLAELWSSGALGGRSFDVLLTRPPLGEIQSRLDAAFTQFPDRVSLADFRAPAATVRAEREALAAARTLYTPHAQLAARFGNRAKRLSWKTSRAGRAENSPHFKPDGALYFPGPPLARNGAWEVRAVAKSLGCAVWASGESEAANFWADIETRIVPRDAWRDVGFWNDIAVVVQPSLGENAPRVLLAALAAGVPVIAGENCGLEAQTNLTTVPFGDAAALLRAVENEQRSTVEIDRTSLLCAR